MTLPPQHPTKPTDTRTYLLTFLALQLLLALTVVAAFLPLGKIALLLSLTIAVAKSLLILSNFMHLRSGPPRVIVFAAAGFFWLAILLSLTFADYLTRVSPSP